MTDPSSDLAALVARSRGGDAAALEELVRQLRGGVHRLALRMTACPDDADDATQEILIKVVTRLDSFRGDATVTTWVYRIATNHLLDRRKSRTERLSMSFSRFADDLLDGLAAEPAETDPDLELLAHEVKQGCTLALLTCLDRDLRIAYVLGEILQLPAGQGAEISAISAPAFRKRLSRARARIRGFLEANCGLVSSTAACHCRRRVPAALASGRIQRTPPSSAGVNVEEAMAELDRAYDAAQLLRSRSDDPPGPNVTEQLVTVLRRGNLRILE